MAGPEDLGLELAAGLSRMGSKGALKQPFFPFRILLPFPDVAPVAENWANFNFYSCSGS